MKLQDRPVCSTTAVFKRDGATWKDEGFEVDKALRPSAHIHGRSNGGVIRTFDLGIAQQTGGVASGGKGEQNRLQPSSVRKKGRREREAVRAWARRGRSGRVKRRKKTKKEAVTVVG